MYQLITVQRQGLDVTDVTTNFYNTLQEAKNAALNSIQSFTKFGTWQEIIDCEDKDTCWCVEQDDEIEVLINTFYITMRWKVIKVPENNRISVVTPAGTFIAKVNNDAVYPGISVFKDVVFPDNMISATEYDPNEQQIKIEAYAQGIDEPVAIIDHETGKDLA